MGKIMTEKKTSFLDAIKAAQATKSKVPEGKAQQVQQAKFKNKVTSNKPTKRAVGRGG
jgi:folate-dependent tRNA-U54 methylase TrmFO/GidA